MISFAVYHNDEDDVIKVQIRVTNDLGETETLSTYFLPGNVAKSLCKAIEMHTEKQGESQPT